MDRQQDPLPDWGKSICGWAPFFACCTSLNVTCYFNTEVSANILLYNWLQIKELIPVLGTPQMLLMQEMCWVLSALSFCQLGEYLQLSLTLLHIQQLNDSCSHFKLTISPTLLSIGCLVTNCVSRPLLTQCKVQNLHKIYSSHVLLGILLLV